MLTFILLLPIFPVYSHKLMLHDVTKHDITWNLCHNKMLYLANGAYGTNTPPELELNSLEFN